MSVRGILGRVIYALAVVVALVFMGMTAFVSFYAFQLQSLNTYTVPERPHSVRILARDGTLIADIGDTRGDVSLDELPFYVWAALVSIEDRRFYSHPGIDPISLASVVLESIAAGHATRGASTITQQLAKNLFLSPDQSYGRKIQEALLAFRLEETYSKNQILEVYLNRVPFGNRATGIEAAARTYFGKSSRDLTLREAANLMGSLKAPSRLNPKVDPIASAARGRVVLQAMANEGYITQAEAEAASIEPQRVSRRSISGPAGSYAIAMVRDQLKEILGEISEDVIVYTTIDSGLQKTAESLIKTTVAASGNANRFDQGALVCIDVDGRVLAVVGGADFATSPYDIAIKSRRQPGSTFKPFVYAAALEHGYTPDTVVDDAPFVLPDWRPENADGKFMGLISLRTALAQSRNTVAARIFEDLGADKIIEVARRVGISSPLNQWPSIALGTSGVSLMELTAGYVPFANGGYAAPARVIMRVETAKGRAIFKAPEVHARIFSAGVVAGMDDMLSTAVEVGTGKKAWLPGWRIAGKTGTTQDARDALFVGYTTKMVTGVWLGNNDNSPTKLTGGGIPTKIWSAFMELSHRDLRPSDR